MSHFAAKNVEHFDKRAASYESRMKLDLTKKVVDQGFLKAPGVTWDPESTVVVDFACGTGILNCDEEVMDQAWFRSIYFLMRRKSSEWI